jgi:hypothetical protein
LKHPWFMILSGLWSNLSHLWSKFDRKLDRGFLIRYLRPNIHSIQFKLGLKCGHNMDNVHYSKHGYLFFCNCVLLWWICLNMMINHWIHLLIQYWNALNLPWFGTMRNALTQFLRVYWLIGFILLFGFARIWMF